MSLPGGGKLGRADSRLEAEDETQETKTEDAFSGWVRAPSKGEFKSRFAVLNRRGIHFYADDTRQRDLGGIRISNILQINESHLKKSKSDTPSRGIIGDDKILALWKKDRTMYYFLVEGSHNATQWKSYIRKQIIAYQQSKNSEQEQEAKAEEEEEEKKSDRLNVSSPKRRSPRRRIHAKGGVQFPLPGVVVLSFADRTFRECVRFFHVERQQEHTKFSKVENRFINVIISPIGLFGLLSLLWAGSADDCPTLNELQNKMAKMPSYHDLDMGHWRCDRRTKAKQLLMWQKNLQQWFTRKYQKEQDRLLEEEVKKQEQDDAATAEQKEKETDEFASPQSTPVPANDESDMDTSRSSRFGGETPEPSEDQSQDRSEERAILYEDRDESKTDGGDDPDITTMFLANCLFIDSSFDLTTTFRKNFKKYCRHARLFDESLHTEIGNKLDEWASRHTLSKGNPIAKHINMAAACSVGVSSLYFRGSFDEAFDPQLTRNQPWYTSATCQKQIKAVPFMTSRRKVLHYSDTSYSICGLSYSMQRHNQLQKLMLILVRRKTTPRSEDSLGKRPINTMDLFRYLSKAKTQYVEISLPKLNLECFVDLSHIFEETGMETMFDAVNANFGRMASNASKRGLFVSQIVHTIRLVIDERGDGSAPDKEHENKTMPHETYNYPFDLFILSPEQDFIFACGRIADPAPLIHFKDEIPDVPPAEKRPSLVEVIGAAGKRNSSLIEGDRKKFCVLL